MNSSFNTVAICPSCNKKKSDKIGIVTVRGMAAKSGELAVGTVQKAVGGALFLFLKVLNLTGKAVIAPLSRKSPLVIKIGYIILIAGVVAVFLRG